MTDFIRQLFGRPTIQHPFVSKVKTQPKTEIETKPDNMVYHAGQAFVRKETSNGFEDTRWNGVSGKRSDTMTSSDMDIITARRLKETKYRELKVYWAAEYSAARVAKEFKGQRGYSQRTVEQYWSAMNAAFSPSPPTR